jgi:hypothetical protein
MASRWFRSDLLFLSLGFLNGTTFVLFVGHVIHPISKAPATTIPQKTISAFMAAGYTL